MPIHFSKMHGAGNDFVLIDLRGGQSAPDAALARAIGDRHTGVGFDQLMTLEPSDVPRLRGALPDLEQRWSARPSNAATARAASPPGCCAMARPAPPRFQPRQPGRRDRRRMPARWPLRAGHGPARFRARRRSRCRRRARKRATTRRWRGETIELRRRGDGQSACAGGGRTTSIRAPVARLGPALQAIGPVPGRRQRRLRPGHCARHDRAARATSAAPAKPWPAAAAPARRWRCWSARDGWTGASTCTCRAAGSTSTWPADDAPVRMAGPATFVFEGEWLA